MHRRSLFLLSGCLILATALVAVAHDGMTYDGMTYDGMTHDGIAHTGSQADAAPTPIGVVQGRGDASPVRGQQVEVAGVVTAVLEEDADAGGGWFMQDAGDGDPATSDALFVIDDGGPPVGERVRIRGEVVEVDAGGGATRTALKPSAVVPLGPAKLPRATVLSAPPADWERYEHMRLRIAAPLTVAGTHRARRDGELLVSFGDRPSTPTEVAAPGAAARALADDNVRRLLWLDDRSQTESPPRLWYLPAGLPRTGSRLGRVEGVLDQADPGLRGGGYRLCLTATPTVRAAQRPRPPRVAGDVRIVGFNLENLFNGDGRGGGFPTPRGARTSAELQAQLDRHVATLRALDPDIVALMELENDGDGPDSSLATLVDALNRGGGDWRYVAAGVGAGGDQIRVGLIYRDGRVAAVGAPATLSGGPFDSLSRPPLAQSFRAGTGPVFTVVANHFKSKGCGRAEGADADQGDGQGCWNAARTESSRRLDAWLRGDPTRSGSDLAIIIGDLNAYAMENPIQTLIAGGWRDAYARGRGAAPYSYVFEGRTGRLDHALLSPAMARRLAGAAKWHTNADEPAGGYREAAARGDAPAEPWRSSDHDPLLLGLRLRRP